MGFWAHGLSMGRAGFMQKPAQAQACGPLASLAGAFLDGGISEHLRRQSQRHGSRRGRELEMP
jgi:hypothetical protein